MVKTFEIMVSPVVRISPNINNTEHDLLRVIYLDEKLRKSNGKYYKRTQCYKKLSALRNTDEYKNLEKEQPPRLENIDHLAEINSKQIFLWNMPNHGQIPELLHQSPAGENYVEINIVAPFFNEPNDYLLLELHLILDIDEFTKKLRKHKEGNIFQCLARSGLVEEASWEEFIVRFGSEEVDFTDEHNFIKKFGVGFEVFCSFHQRKAKTVYKILHRSRHEGTTKKYMSLEFVGKKWEEGKSLISKSDQFILRPNNYFNSYPCPNSNCTHYAISAFHLKRHLNACTNETRFEYKQCKLSDATIREYCITKGFIPPRYHQRNFCTFDIESVGQNLDPDANSNSSTNIMKVQRVVSVSISKSFGNMNTKVITRKSMNETDYTEFIRQFMTYLDELSEEYINTLPSVIKTSLVNIIDNLSAFKNKERNYSFHQVKELSNAKYYLENICRLKVYGYNSSKYDLPCLFPGLLNYSEKYNSKISVIKRGNAFLSLRIKNLVFADICNFTSGCSLDSFTRMWGAETTKSIFPYEKFKSVESLENETSWPPISDFKSSLHTHSFKYSAEDFTHFINKLRSKSSHNDARILQQLDPSGHSSSIADLVNSVFPIKLDVYIEMWLYYEEQYRLGKMKSMLDYLRYYNSLDTISLVQAFQNYITSFLDNFDCNPNDFLTLPGLAERVMWSKFTSDKYAAYTVGNSFGHVNKLIRKHLMGGLSCVFHRHIEVGPSADEFDRKVTTAKNGQKFDRIVAMDANSK